MSSLHVVIGGGPAGVFAAIRCKTCNPSAQVVLLEKTNQLLAKVRISGGGRCNVTHACFDPRQLIQNYPRGAKELLGPFHHFQPKDTVSWFEDRGVFLKTEDDGRMFPVTDSSETIVQCLLKEAAHAGIEIRKQQRIQSLQKLEDHFLIQLDNQQIKANSILLATGSSSWGHGLAKEFGHTIIKPVPSLFTFNIPSSPLLDLSGISVSEVIVSLKGFDFKQKGPVLLTHWGFSGPAILKLSAWAARALYDLSYKAVLQINWLAALNQEIIYQNLVQSKINHPLQAMPSLLPSNLLSRLCADLHMDSTIALGRLPNKTLEQLAAKLYCDEYLIEGQTTYKQEFVTAGGVDLRGIDFRTMESKIVPGLFFAGEILNIDGVTGGFNFQNAWTTGWLAGTGMGNLKSCIHL